MRASLYVRSFINLKNNLASKSGIKASYLKNSQILALFFCLFINASIQKCPVSLKFGSGPPKSCHSLWDPNQKPSTRMEQWFTREIFNVRNYFSFKFDSFRTYFQRQIWVSLLLRSNEKDQLRMGT
jgi:hypothetical protein